VKKIALNDGGIQMRSDWNKLFKISMAASIVLLAGVLAGAAIQKEYARQVVALQEQEPLRNFGVVWENKLTRSGLPHDKSGWDWLRQTRGAKSIVTFRPQNDVDYEKYGFDRVYRIPLSGTEVPTDEQVDTFLRFVQDPGNWPVHMHCSAGKDRTGMMAVLVRYAIDGWPIEKALEESRSYRGGEDLPHKRLAWLQSWAANHKPGSYKLSSWNLPGPSQTVN
jgi:Tyrosine phosphatase family